MPIARKEIEKSVYFTFKLPASAPSSCKFVMSIMFFFHLKREKFDNFRRKKVTSLWRTLWFVADRSYRQAYIRKKNNPIFCPHTHLTNFCLHYQPQRNLH